MRTAILVFFLGMSSLLGHAGTKCRPVGGAVSTNFINSSTTFGTATGDLSGGIGVSVLSLAENSDLTVTFHNEHHWVTASGDTIFTNPAYAIGYPTPVAGLYAVKYTDGVSIIGGTGKFMNATGKIHFWGAVNIGSNEVILRYEGSVCSAESDED